MKFTDGEDNLPGPGVYLRGEDPVLGTPMQHYSELRAQTIEKAAYYLDVALNVRNSSPESHMLYTLNVYQYTVPTGSSAGNDDIINNFFFSRNRYTVLVWKKKYIQKTICWFFEKLLLNCVFIVV